jgi:CDP-glycerol glycerophosphotransferase (TagB/SpsB family)
MAHVGGGKGDWEFDDRSLSLLINSLVHSDIIITMYSTFFIEGAIFNKPLIGVAYDGDKILPYWNSVSRFFSEWDHLRDLDHCGGIKLVRSNEEFLEAINTYFAHGENESDGRKKIIDEEVNFTDGKAGERLANVLITALN